MNEQDILDRARAMADPAQRAAFLDEACGGDCALRDRIEQQLMETDETLVTGPPEVGSGGDPNLADIAETTGSVIGPYRLCHRLGEGDPRAGSSGDDGRRR